MWPEPARALLAAALLLMAGSAGSSGGATDTNARIVQAIGAARCNADSDCRTLGIGSRPCGGPERYLAWSVLDGDAKRLKSLAAMSEAEQRQQNEREGIASTCELRPDPGARCERPASPGAGRCVLKESAGSDRR